MPDGTFSGAHINGDVLVLSDFTNGGGTPTVRVFEWHSPGGLINGTLDLIGGSLAPDDCAIAGDDDPFCATVNDVTTPSPWAFKSKSGVDGSFPPGDFYEGGIDLAALGVANECFSNVIFETRSSQSVDATLKDFVAGGFENCGAHISISPSGVNAVGGSHTFTVTVTQNIGGTESPVAGLHPTVTLTAAGGAAVAAGKVDTCATTGTNAAGQCTVTFTSNTAGTVTGHAAASVTIQGTVFTVETNGQAGNSGDALKRFVDASVTIAASAVNAVGNEHTFTINVTPLAAGATIDSVTITPSLSPVPVAPQTTSNTCATPTLSSGVYSCTLTVNSPTPGTFTANASTTVNFSSAGGTPSTASVTRSTSGTSGPAGSGPATKRFVDANIAITPATATNAVGTNHVLTITVNAVNGKHRRRQPHGHGDDRERPRQLRRWQHLQLHRWGCNRLLHGDDHLGRHGHDRRLRELRDPGRRPNRHPHDRDGGEHDRPAARRERVEGVGGREHRRSPRRRRRTRSARTMC